MKSIPSKKSEIAIHHEQNINGTNLILGATLSKEPLILTSLIKKTYAMGVITTNVNIITDATEINRSQLFVLLQSQVSKIIRNDSKSEDSTI